MSHRGFDRADRGDRSERPEMSKDTGEKKKEGIKDKIKQFLDDMKNKTKESPEGARSTDDHKESGGTKSEKSDWRKSIELTPEQNRKADEAMKAYLADRNKRTGESDQGSENDSREERTRDRER